ncbi:MAG TPA: 2'-5' RNA ligase family protein [Ferruginibacter sp.]|nr:2'-5' RNA ligase family protein [Ferruginibacter sp.]
METPSILVPGYQEYDYSIIIVPHEELRHKITDARAVFNEKYKTTFPVLSRPAITLATFRQIRLMEERIVNRLHIIAMSYHSFKVELKDFGSFPSHSVFINVTSKLPVQDLVKTIRHDAQRLMKLDADNKPHFIIEPYILIARKLLPWQYEKGWLEYSHKHFTSRFIADNMLLLRRPAGEFKYAVVQRFEFMNLPVTTKQGELF